jgi:hypothetical protein
MADDEARALDQVGDQAAALLRRITPLIIAGQLDQAQLQVEAALTDAAAAGLVPIAPLTVARRDR